MKLLAQRELGTLEGIGDLGRLDGPLASNVFGQFNGIISLTLGVLTVSGGLWFIFQFFGGALQWLASGGEKQALQSAQKRIVNALIGLILVIFSYTIIALIGRVFGLNIFSPLDALLGNGFPASPGGSPGGGPGNQCPPGGCPIPQ